ncbi:MAG: hypothetical protein B655_1248 [Methanobacterium sp. Maddingley MBC34]|nr:MAG: hypothetical protein B655_1248 [Methanobacterium sp. Maddingley MBC34]
MKPSMKMDFKQCLLKRGIPNDAPYKEGYQKPYEERISDDTLKKDFIGLSHVS